MPAEPDRTNLVELPPIAVSAAAPSNSVKADKAWKELQREVKSTPMPPLGFVLKGIAGRLGPEDLQKAIGAFAIPLEIRKADLARSFYADYPGDSRALDARMIEYEHLAQAYRMTPEITNLEWQLSVKAQQRLSVPAEFTFTNLLPRMEAMEAEFARAADLSNTGRFRYRVEQLYRRTLGSMDGPAWDEFAHAALALQADFPEKKDPYSYLRAAVDRGTGDQARALAEKVVASLAPEEEKAQFRGYLHLLDSVGKPLSIQLAALDGRTVDTSKMAGHVVLVDFWATWCSPCVEEMPALRALFEKYHAQGLEIIGISLDAHEDKGRVTKFLKSQKIGWPQYFDGKELKNDLALKFGVNGIPTHFLLDKRGVLRDKNARAGLEDEIRALLAEP
jgi:thiol-disulfide isomerase/thioredoxin